MLATIRNFLSAATDFGSIRITVSERSSSFGTHCFGCCCSLGGNMSLALKSLCIIVGVDLFLAMIATALFIAHHWKW